MTATVKPGILESIDQDPPAFMAWCPCAWMGEPRTDHLRARADLLVHRAEQHGEAL